MCLRRTLSSWFDRRRRIDQHRTLCTRSACSPRWPSSTCLRRKQCKKIVRWRLDIVQRRSLSSWFGRWTPETSLRGMRYISCCRLHSIRSKHASGTFPLRMGGRRRSTASGTPAVEQPGKSEERAPEEFYTPEVLTVQPTQTHPLPRV